MPTSDCLYTTLVNISGSERVFGFIPPHGKRLADEEQVTVFGDFVTRIAGHTRKRAAFEAALVAGTIAIRSSPAMFVFDETLSETLQLSVVNDEVSFADPCFGEYIEA